MRHDKDGLTWHSFEIFRNSPQLRHGCFTRAGAEGGTMNFSFAAWHDKDELVAANIERAAHALGLPYPASVRQTHGDSICLVLPEDRYQPKSQAELRDGFDAMLAPSPGVSMLIKTADCQAVLLYDPAVSMLALAHSGWRGSVLNIIGKTIGAMVSRGAVARRILAAVSPSLGPCCAEFVNYKSELPEKFQIFKTAKNKFDFWAISRKQMTDCGILPENIEISGICSKCSPDYFSYRGGDLWARSGLLAGINPVGNK